MKHPMASLVFLVLWASCCIPAATALTVSGLYSHEIAVANQSDQERSRAFREAMVAVIIKLTGEQQWVDNPRIQQALDTAQNFVQAIEYRTERRLLDGDEAELTGTPDPSQPLRPEPTYVDQELLNVSFSRDLVDQLLADAAIPVWDSNRPSLLVWMSLQNDAGERRLLSADSNPAIIDLMQSFARTRGIPIIFPLLDFADRRALSPNVLWSLDEQAIIAASRRYAPDSILSGRLHFTASGELVGLWQFIFQDRIQMFDALDTDLGSYIQDSLDQVTTQLARHFAVIPTPGGEGIARLRVEGIDSLAAYAELVKHLQELVLVESVTVTSVNGQALELDLSLQGSPGQLVEMLSLDRNLSLLEPGGAENPQGLRYRWTR